MYSCAILRISTDSLTETTQIWGKEFPGSMFLVMPGNSSFLFWIDLGQNQDLQSFSPPPPRFSVPTYLIGTCNLRWPLRSCPCAGFTSKQKNIFKTEQS
jgi:hypothetical protein